MKITGNINIPAQAEAALRAGNKIEAIRLIRQSMNIGLAESKAVLDNFVSNPVQGGAPASQDASSQAAARSAQPLPRVMAPSHMTRDGLSPGEVPRGNNAMVAVIFIVAIVVGIGAYIKFG
jgi:hypothetical protein